MSLIDTVCDMIFDRGLLPTASQGSCLEPAAGSTSPAASTRAREFGFEVRSCCVCMCVTVCFVCLCASGFVSWTFLMFCVPHARRSREVGGYIYIYIYIYIICIDTYSWYAPGPICYLRRTGSLMSGAKSKYHFNDAIHTGPVLYHNVRTRSLTERVRAL